MLVRVKRLQLAGCGEMNKFWFVFLHAWRCKHLRDWIKFPVHDVNGHVGVIHTTNCPESFQQVKGALSIFTGILLPLSEQRKLYNGIIYEALVFNSLKVLRSIHLEVRF